MEYGLDTVKYWYYKGVNLEHCLRMAIECARCDIIDWLLPRLLPYLSFDRCKLMTLTCEWGDVNLFNTMLKYGVPINSKCIFKACYNGNVEILLQLYLHGADIHACGKNGWNALHYACDNAQFEVVELLLDWGVQQVPNKYGNYPLSFACSYGYVKIIELLFKYPVDREITRSIIEERKYCVTTNIICLLKQLTNWD